MIADNDYNIIKPVESPQHTSTLTPVKPREQRKRKQPDREKSGQKINQPQAQQQTEKPISHDKDDEHSIDYCA